MSAKNSLFNKKVRRLERALRKGRLPRYIDLADWCKDHGHADTMGAVLRLIIDDRIVADSHPLGKRIVRINPEDEEDMRRKQIIDRLVPASLRGSIHVIEREGT